jgi:hypothetical protein
MTIYNASGDGRAGLLGGILMDYSIFRTASADLVALGYFVRSVSDQRKLPIAPGLLLCLLLSRGGPMF